VEVLGDSALREVEYLADRDPFVNAVVSARLRAVATLRPDRLGGLVVGLRQGGNLVAACYVGGNLVPIGGDRTTWPALARFVAQQPTGCTAIAGRADAVGAMWQLLARSWAPARQVRPEQPLLMIDRPAALPADESVQRARPAELERYLPAAAAMFAEELGVSPHVAPGTASFRSRVTDLLCAGRAFASYDFRGQVTFKAEIGAVSPHTCQVQGVWVRPDLRRRGLGTAGLAAVISYALELAPTVSLYVNDYNTAARRMYARLGMRQVATLSTVLL
jgi:uncharacterized protein